MLVLKRGATSFERSVSDDLSSRRARILCKGERAPAAHWGSIEASHQGERGHTVRGSELRATYRGSKKIMLSVGGAYR